MRVEEFMKKVYTALVNIKLYSLKVIILEEEFFTRYIKWPNHLQ